MINAVLKFLAEQLNVYLLQDKKNDDVKDPCVEVQNIARIDGVETKIPEKILVTLINIAEDQALKNLPGHTVTKDDMVSYGNPPVNLNLYILFTACMSKYENELIYLSHVITFFQGKNIFTVKNSLTQVEGLPEDMRIILDLYSLSFEQMNFLWSTLGGKQHPFVCYKVRLVKLERASTTEIRGIITEVDIEGV
jgi:hypothetical protein